MCSPVLTITQPTLSLRQLDLDAISMAVLIKYSSHDGLSSHDLTRASSDSTMFKFSLINQNA